MEQAALIGGVLQWAVPTKKEILEKPLMDDEILGYPPMGMWSKVALLLEEWAPPQDSGEVEVLPEAVLEALYKIEKSLKKQAAHVVAGAVWPFFHCINKGHKGEGCTPALLRETREEAA